MIEKLTKSGYLKDVYVVFTGTSFAQLISILSAPILSRIFSPEEFGLFAVYLAVVSIAAILITARYELTILLPKQNTEAFNLLIAVIKICLIMGFFLFILILFLKKYVLPDHPAYANNVAQWIWLLPLSVLVTGCCQSLAVWINRNRHFMTLSQGKVAQSTSNVFFQVSLGKGGLSVAGMVLGDFIGRLVLLFIYLKKVKSDWSQLKENVSWPDQKALLKRYYKFPLLQTPSALLNVGAHQTPNLLLAPLFSSTAAGFYFMTQRLLQMPVSLLSNAILEVFKQRVADHYNRGQTVRLLYLKTFFILLSISLPPAIVAFFVVEDLFAWVLGESWRVVGVYAKILLPAMVMKMVASPLSYMLIVAEKHTLNLTGMLCLFVGMVLACFLSGTIEQAINYISIVLCLVYLFYLLVSSRIAEVF